MEKLVQKFFKQEFLLDTESIYAVSGGDIASSYQVFTENDHFFVKVMPNSTPNMAKVESDGLNVLRGKSSLYVPQVIAQGTENAGTEVLVLEHLKERPVQDNNWVEFGQGLAELHLNYDDSFGFQETNYIGSVIQKNTQQNTWGSFYGSCRILPLIAKVPALKSEFSRLSQQTLQDKIQDIFPCEKPSLLHGDLWSGNVMNTTKGMAIYDPAVYYGHREMDIAMTFLFDGFDKKYLNAYQEVYPLEQQWEERVELCQLYPLLVHAVLFGGSYVNSSSVILRKYFS